MSLSARAACGGVVPAGLLVGIASALHAASALPEGALAAFGRVPPSGGAGVGAAEPSADWSDLTTFACAVSRGGRWVARGERQGAVELWDTASGGVTRLRLPPSNARRALAFTPDGKALAVSLYDHVQLLRVPGLTAAGMVALAVHDGSLEFSADGRYLASYAATGLLRVFDLATGKEAWSLEEVWSAAFTSDGRAILVVSRDRAAMRLYEVATRKILFDGKRPQDRGARNSDGGSKPAAVAFSPDGGTAALALSGGHVCLLDTATGRERGRFLGMPTPDDFADGRSFLHATALAFSPDGQWLAAGGGDGRVRLWDVSTRRELHRLRGHEPTVVALAFSADGRRLVSLGVGEGLVWDLRPGRGGKPAADPFADLLSEDGPTVYRAVWALADDPRAPARLREHIPPGRPDARPDRIALLIAGLGSPRFAEREAATRDLAALEELARPGLLAALRQKPVLEKERRLRKLLDALEGEPAPAQLRVLRAVHALDLNGGEAARRVLQEWSEGTPGLRLTDAARAALARRGRRPDRASK